MFYLELLRALEVTLSRWSRLLLQSLAPTNPHWARMVGYSPFSLWVIHMVGIISVRIAVVFKIILRKSYFFIAKPQAAILNGLVWWPEQKKRIAPLSFLHGCRKRRLEY
jgi:hypothetical protein